MLDIAQAVEPSIANFQQKIMSCLAKIIPRKIFIIYDKKMIEVKNITKTYKTGDVEFNALNDISFDIADGEFVAIMGPSGSGKSTLMHILGALDSPTSGQYFLDNKDISILSHN